MLLMSRHGFFGLIPLPSEPLPLCRLCPEFRSLPTVPVGTGAFAPRPPRRAAGRPLLLAACGWAGGGGWGPPRARRRRRARGPARPALAAPCPVPVRRRGGARRCVPSAAASAVRRLRAVVAEARLIAAPRKKKLQKKKKNAGAHQQLGRLRNSGQSRQRGSGSEGSGMRPKNPWRDMRSMADRRLLVSAALAAAFLSLGLA